MNSASLFDFVPFLLSLSSVEVLLALAFASQSWPPWLTLSLCFFGQLLQLLLLSCRSAHRLSLYRSTFCIPFQVFWSSVLQCRIRISSTILSSTLSSTMRQNDLRLLTATSLCLNSFRTNTSSATTENIYFDSLWSRTFGFDVYLFVTGGGMVSRKGEGEVNTHEREEGEGNQPHTLTKGRGEGKQTHTREGEGQQKNKTHPRGKRQG